MGLFDAFKSNNQNEILAYHLENWLPNISKSNYDPFRSLEAYLSSKHFSQNSIESFFKAPDPFQAVIDHLTQNAIIDYGTGATRLQTIINIKTIAGESTAEIIHLCFVYLYFRLGVDLAWSYTTSSGDKKHIRELVSELKNGSYRYSKNVMSCMALAHLESGLNLNEIVLNHLSSTDPSIILEYPLLENLVNNFGGKEIDSMICRIIEISYKANTFSLDNLLLAPLPAGIPTAVPQKRVQTGSSIKITKQNAEMLSVQFLKILNDCADIVNETKNPDTFFQRYELMLQKVDQLNEASRYVKFRGTPPHKLLEQITAKRDLATKDMIDRYYLDMATKIDALKTQKAKLNKATTFYSTLAAYNNQMSQQNIEYVLQKYLALKDFAEDGN